MKFLKKMFLGVIVIAFLFTLLPHQSEAATYKPGDIFITKSTSAKGVTGHVGIAIDSKTILHTSGRKGEPYPLAISIKDWGKRYSKTKVIRPNSSSLGEKAATMAKKYFKGKKISYNIPSATLKGSKYTYCSQLVWKSYYKAGKSYETASQIGNAGRLTWKVPLKILPYDFSNKTYVKHNGFKFVKSTWGKVQ